MRTDDAVALLRAHGAADIPHPGGTLLEHLVRVADELHAWGNPEAVVLAGLCHATYGTDGFAPSLLTLDQREVLREVIGEDAEALVYQYGSCARKPTYATLGVPGEATLCDRWTGGVHRLDARERNAFVEITVANELDVLAHNADLAARHGPSILRELGEWRPMMSGAARARVDASLA